MRKVLVTVLTIMIAFTLLLGCTIASAKMKNVNYHKREMSFNNKFDLYIDPETGVQYIVICEVGFSGVGVAMTPRLNADGKPMIDSSYVKKVHW